MNYNLDTCEISQGFGLHPEIYRPMRGHPAVDIRCGYGSPIHSPVDQYIYKVLTVGEPASDGSGFTGTFGIVDDGIELYELLIGHSDPSVAVGDFVKKGDVLGTEANHGPVWADGKPITLAEQKAGSKEGTHRHVQKRPVMKVLHTDVSHKYLSCYSDWPAGSIYRDLDGHYYQIWDYDNGYHGCIDLSKSVLHRNLTLGLNGYDVYVLQRILVKAGMGTFAPTGYFGALTQQALAKFQTTIGVHPDVGYFGPLTRAAIINIYNV